MCRPSSSIVCVAWLFFWAGAAFGATITVGPGSSIQTAVDLLLLNSDPTDAVLVQPGVYGEKVVIDFSGTNQQALVVARATSVRPLISGGIEVKNARIVTLGGLKVSSPAGDLKAAIDVHDCTAVAVVDSIAVAGDDLGFEANDCFEIVLVNSRFDGMSDTTGAQGIGVRISGGCAHFLEDLECDGNETAGIWVEADETEVRHCEASANGTAGAGAGLHLEGMRNAVKKGSYNGNDGRGVEVVGTARLKSVEVKKNTGAGIRVGEDGGLTSFGGQIKKCSVSKNDKAGIVVRSGHSGLEILENKLSGNGGAGVRLLGDRCHVRKNTIKGTKSGSAGGHGVVIEVGADGHCIDVNLFKNNAGEAVDVRGDDNYLLANIGSGGDGFVLEPGATGNDGRANVSSGHNDFP